MSIGLEQFCVRETLTCSEVLALLAALELMPAMSSDLPETSAAAGRVVVVPTTAALLLSVAA